MQRLREKLAAFQRSRLGQFLKKFNDDQATNLAALLAWGTLSTLLPLLLGILALAGLVLRDPERLDQVYNTLLYLIPSGVSGPLGEALQNVRNSAGTAGVVGLVLLLWNGSAFFGNMASVFNHAFHVEDRNFVMQRLISIAMLLITSTLLVLATVALGFGSVLDALPFALPFGPELGKVVSWSISIVSTIVLFVLIYKVLPNKPQSWSQVLPGALLATLLFFGILQVFPLYVKFFPPNQAYAVFGIFLVFTFFLYLLGLVFILGTELNAFLQEPARAVALAEATSQARQGEAEYRQRPNQVEAETTGRAPNLGGPLQPREVGGGAKTAVEDKPRDKQPERGPGIGGRLIGLVGLIVAAALLRGRTVRERRQTVSS
jgi:membrane protein